jgi:hypothetical protein
MTATALPSATQRTVHRRPGSTRAAKRRVAVVAELIGELGRQPNASERHLIATIADLTVQREALASAQLRGEPVDSMALLKIAGLITRTISALRGKTTGKARGATGPTLADYLARKAAEKAASASAGDGA